LGSAKGRNSSISDYPIIKSIWAFCINQKNAGRSQKSHKEKQEIVMAHFHGLKNEIDEGRKQRRLVMGGELSHALGLI